MGAPGVAHVYNMLLNPTHGELSNSTPDTPPSSTTTTTTRFRFERVPLKIVNRNVGDLGGISQGGSHGLIVLEGEWIKPNSTSSTTNNTVLLFMHPAAIMNMLPFPAAVARSGVNVVTCHTRFANFDYSLTLEECIQDVGCAVKYCRDALDFENVVLVGWSGGGSLMAYYQSVAESKTEDNNYPAADAYVAIAAHAGRARILTECLDPSVYLLEPGTHPKEEQRLQRFNLYGKNPPSLSDPTFLTHFRQAQIDRNHRISTYAREHPGSAFVVQGTMMDPRWIDASIDPNDRTKHFDSYLGDPRIANTSITGLARFSSSESWLSQWSLKHSKGDGVHHARNISAVPCLFIENGADNAVPVQHIQDMFAACAATDKEYYKVKNATHYYTNQRDKLNQAANVLTKWLNRKGFVSIVVSEQEANRDKTMDVSRLAKLYDGANAMEIQGVNHVALVSSDMERTCEFYGSTLGLRLSKTIALPNGGQHFFFDLGLPEQSIAFFWFPNAPPARPGSSAPDVKTLLSTGEHPSAHGSMNHLAFNVPEQKLTAYRKRLLKSAHCSFVSPVVFHADTKSGMAVRREDERVTWASVYFFGPDGELLELTSQCQSFEDREKHVQHLPRKALWRTGGKL